MGNELGCFIAFEGPDCSGKSTQIKKAEEHIKVDLGMDCWTCREPGTTQLGQELRKLLKNPDVPINDVSQILLFSAARYQLWKDEIEPRLKQGIHVLCDRFILSTLVYQVLATDKVYDYYWISNIRDLYTYTIPILRDYENNISNIVINIDYDTYLKRRTNGDHANDRFENESEESKLFMNHVIRSYQYLWDRVGCEFGQIYSVLGTKPEEEVYRDVCDMIDIILGRDEE